MSPILKKTKYCSSVFLDKRFQSPPLLATPTVMYHCDNESNWAVSFIGNSCEEIFKYSKQQFLSHEINLGDLINQHDKEMIWNTVQIALREQVIFELLYQMITADHENKVIYEKGEGVFDEHGQLIKIIGFMSDVSHYYAIDSDNYCLTLEKCAAEIYERATSIKNRCGVKSQKLSLREVETLVHLCKGKSMKEIGADMNISCRTVEMNIRNAKNKVHCISQRELRNLFYMTDTGKQLILKSK